MKNIFHKTKISFLIFLLFFSVCERNEEKIKKGFNFLENGDLEKSLIIFQKLYHQNRNNPEVLRGLGMLLSLRIASFSIGLDLLEKSLLKKSNPSFRKQLIIFYIVTQNIERMEKLLVAEKLNSDNIYNSNIIQMDILYQCITKPNLQKLKKLSSKLIQNQDTFYYFLCNLFIKNKKRYQEELLNQFNKIQDDKEKCNIVVVWLSQTEKPERFLKKEKEICKKKFLGLISVHREDFEIRSYPKEDIERNKVFYDKIFQPKDPGPKLLYRPRILKKNEEELEEKLEEDVKEDEEESEEK